MSHISTYRGNTKRAFLVVVNEPGLIMPSNRDRKQIDVRTTTRNRVIVIGVLPEQLRPPVEPVTNYPRAETHQQTKPTHLA